MRARCLVAVALLLLAALAAAPSSLYASQPSSQGSSQVPSVLGILHQAWHSVANFLGWLGAVRPDLGCSPDPNGGACPGSPTVKWPAVERPTPPATGH